MGNRKSNFELLRIFAMFSIILFHYANNRELLFSEISIVTLKYILLIPIGGGGVNLFLMITSWFSLGVLKVDFHKIRNIYAVTIFYSISILVFFALYVVNSVSMKNLLHSVFPVSYGTYWFVTAYIGLLLLIPFLNIFWSKIDFDTKKKLIYTLSIMLFLLSILPNSKGYYSELLWVVYIFFFMQWYKENPIKMSSSSILFLIIGIYLLAVLMTFALIILSGHYKVDIYAIYLVRSQGSFVSFSISILIFELFRRIKLDNRMVNFVASGTFGIYIIHENFILRSIIWNDIFHVKDHFYSKNYVLYGLFCTILIFIFCFLVEQIRIIFFKLILLIVNFGKKIVLQK